MKNVVWKCFEKNKHFYVVTMLGKIKSSDIAGKILQKYKHTLLPIQVGSGMLPNLGVECDFFICGNNDVKTKRKIEEIKIEVEALLSEHTN